MVPEFFAGLPVHILVVHFVVVLLPLAALGAVVVALWPAARKRYGWLVVAVAAVATVLVQIAADSGDNLANRVPPTPEIDEHARLGEQLLWWALPLFIAVTALMIVHETARRQSFAQRPGSADVPDQEPEPGAVKVQVQQQERTATWLKPATMAIAALTVAAAVGAGIHVYRVGDAGARAVWGYIEEQPPNG
jgi:uncharacterized membrane protein